MQNTTVLEEEPPGPGPFARFFHFTAFRSSLLMRASNTATSASLSCENPTLNDYANTPKDSATENLAATNSRHRGGGTAAAPVTPLPPPAAAAATLPSPAAGSPSPASAAAIVPAAPPPRLSPPPAPPLYTAGHDVGGGGVSCENINWGLGTIF